MNSEFLESYAGQSTDELIALSETCRVDSIVLAFEEALTHKKLLSEEEYTILSVEAIEREVNNGGFSQFFYNSSREFTFRIEKSFIRIGCPVTAALCKKAIDVLGISEGMTSEQIHDRAADATEEQGQALNEIDEIYYQGSEEPIAEKLFTFIKQNRSTIALGAP